MELFELGHISVTNSVSSLLEESNSVDVACVSNQMKTH